MKWEGLGMQQCAPAPHHAAVVPLALAAEAEGAEVGAEAAVMEGQEKSLSEAEICRELPQELPRAVQEQQEHCHQIRALFIYTAPKSMLNI